MNIIIPMAGLGQRFMVEGYNDIKPLIKINSIPMIELAVNTLNIDGQYIFIVNKANKQLNELISVLKRIKKDSIIIELDNVTDGPASTALKAKDYVNNNDELIITNCDQIMKWDSNKFIESTKKNIDGCIVTYNVSTIKNSYVQIDQNGYAIRIAEKEIISEYSLNGIHYWKCGKYFVESAEKMIEKNIRVNNEFYISETYNELIQLGKKISIHNINENEHWAVGTPEDLLKYLKHENI